MLQKRPWAGSIVPAGSTKTLSPTVDAFKLVKLDTLTGSVVTLPPALGSMRRFDAIVTVLATSNSHIVKVANAVDVMRGIIHGHRVDSGNAVLAFTAGTNDDTVTLNRTTTGSVSLGECLTFQDIASGIWHVYGRLSATGAAFATPFSATVS